MHHFDAAGIKVYALSYDEPDALRDFATAHGITYTLLPDPDSEVIRSFGILNTLIAEDDHPWFGIPYPGTYVIDSAGTITHKFFENNLAVRAGPEQLLRAATGARTEPTIVDTPPAATSSESVEMSVALDGAALARTVQRDLVVHLRVPAGQHLYAEPAPAGSVAVDVVLDANSQLVLRPLIRPGFNDHISWRAPQRTFRFTPEM